MDASKAISCAFLLTAIAAASQSDAQVYTQTYPGVRFVANLTGGTTGDPDGRGIAYVWADRVRNRICATVNVTNIQLPASAYLRVRTWSDHLMTLTSKTGSGCAFTDEYTAVTISAMLRGNYLMYVGVDNNQYGRALFGTLKQG